MCGLPTAGQRLASACPRASQKGCLWLAEGLSKAHPRLAQGLLKACSKGLAESRPRLLGDVPKACRKLTESLPNAWRQLTESLPKACGTPAESLRKACRKLAESSPNACRRLAQGLPKACSRLVRGFRLARSVQKATGQRCCRASTLVFSNITFNTYYSSWHIYKAGEELRRKCSHCLQLETASNNTMSQRQYYNQKLELQALSQPFTGTICGARGS